MGDPLRHALGGPAGVVRQVQERAQAVHALAERGVWDRLFDDLVADRKNPYLMPRLDHRPGSPAGGHWPQKGGQDKALGRSRGGLSTKIHLLANGLGEPVAFRLTGGQAGEFAEALPLLEGRQAEIVMADRGYDSNAIVAAIESIGAEAVIPSKICRKVQRLHDRTLYKLRNCIERCFNRLKHFRRLATRYCKRRVAFQATVTLACAWLHLEQYVDTAWEAAQEIPLAL
jgi:transposase